MSENEPEPAAAGAEATRAKIKRAARRLFVERGVENVSIRDIVSAAGQRNGGAVGYYFRSKEALFLEILTDGARLIDQRRIAMLDALERDTASVTLRAVLAVMVRSSVEFEEEQASQTYIRFFALARQNDPSGFADAVLGSHDIGFRRCITHLRRLRTDIPGAILNQRIGLMMLMMGGGLALREQAEEPRGVDVREQLMGGGPWNAAAFTENLIDACEGIVTQPVSVAAGASIIGGAG